MDEEADLYGLEATPQEHAAALAAVLRKSGVQEQFGLLGQLSGDRVLSGVGKSLLGAAEQGYGRVQQGEDRRLQRTTEAQRNAALAKFHQGLLDAKDAGTVKLINAPDGTTMGVNSVTGEVTPIHTSVKKLSRGGGAEGGGAGAAGGLKPKDLEQEWKALASGVSTYAGRGNLNKENRASLQRAEALETLLNVPDLNTITDQQKREAATALAGLISRGGSQAVSQIEHLTPDSYVAQFSNFKQKLLNEPQGAEAGKFLQNMLDTAAREKGLISKQILRGQMESIPNHAHLRKLNGARFESILRGAGVDPAAVDENGLPVQAAAGAAPSGKVRVRIDGQVGFIPVEKLEEAKRDHKAEVIP